MLHTVMLHTGMYVAVFANRGLSLINLLGDKKIRDSVEMYATK